MLRFLVSLIIIGTIIWGLWNFLNPINQLANRVEGIQDEYSTLLSEALGRNGVSENSIQKLLDTDSKNIPRAIEQGDTNEDIILKDPQRDLSSFGKWDRNTNTQNNDTPGTLEYEKNIIAGNVQAGASILSQRKTRENGNSTDTPSSQGFFGTPPLPDTRVGSGNTGGGIIFDPPLELPIIERRGEWYFGGQIIRREFPFVRHVPFFFM